MVYTLEELALQAALNNEDDTVQKILADLSHSELKELADALELLNELVMERL